MPVTIRNPFRKAAPPALLNTASDSAVLHRQAGSSTSSLGEEETRSTPATGAPSRSASAISIADDDRNSYKMSGELCIYSRHVVVGHCGPGLLTDMNVLQL